METSALPSEVFEWISDLERYPAWLEIVPRASPSPPDGGAPAWSVDLRGRWGPFARSKRLRMVRTEHDPPHRVVFERRELDGRRHASWVLVAEISGGDPTVLTMDLSYDGRFASKPLELLLRQEIERSRARLRSHLGDT